jgi:hypothetical protein
MYGRIGDNDSTSFERRGHANSSRHDDSEERDGFLNVSGERIASEGFSDKKLMIK